MNETNGNLKYVAGIDGGGTKTACMISDNHGHILSYVITEGSNHQICGLAYTAKCVINAIRSACIYANIGFEQLSFIYLGMAGADLKEDIVSLSSIFHEELGGIQFIIENDRWNVFACGLNAWGAVSICGTGSSMAVKEKKGRVLASRALGYMLGNCGGGNYLAKIALHHAFRCDEHTGVYTRLVTEVPLLCECISMEELAARIYASGYQYQARYNISKLVFKLAAEGDVICRKIIQEMGEEMGEMIANLIKEAGLKQEAVPVILSGSLYVTDKNRLLLQSLENKIRKTVPLAEFQTVTCPPAVGAVFMALEKINVYLTEETRREMMTGEYRARNVSVPLGSIG